MDLRIENAFHCSALFLKAVWEASVKYKPVLTFGVCLCFWRATLPLFSLQVQHKPVLTFGVCLLSHPSFALRSLSSPGVCMCSLLNGCDAGAVRVPLSIAP